MMVGAAIGALTARLNCFELLPPTLAARIVTLNVPTAVAFPLIEPEDAARVKPAGSAPPITVQVIGEVPLANSRCE